ncbi:NUDIX hydrolase [Clostridium sp. Marseille-QA1073]
MREKTFGIRLENEKYKDRIGVYAIIFNSNGKAATVKTEKGYFLIGGGIKNEETHEKCLIRECLEETGYDIKIKEFICKSDRYHYSDPLNCYFHPIGYFYLANLKSKVQEPIEIDHKLEWISIKELEEKMYLEHQIWAIEQAINL